MPKRNGDHGSWASVEQRVTEVYGWLVAGMTTPQIYKMARNPDPELGREPWDVSERTVRTYIAKARVKLEEAAKTIHQQELGKAIARLDALYRTATVRKDHRGALMVEAKRIELLGLRAPERIEVTNILSAVEDAIAEKRREVAELERQYGLPAAPDTP